SGSKLLVAINRDPDANIFKEADLGVVGEYRQVLPSLIARLKTLHE
ncbi:MAG: electron transfer flavoprotein subunit alpha/FixB family protein, partial [Pseudomonadota bacterium]